MKAVAFSSKNQFVLPFQNKLLQWFAVTRTSFLSFDFS